MRVCWILLSVLGMVAAAAAEPIRIDVPSRTTPVDFAQEIAPLLRANCVACHNAQKKEGGLSLETPASILRGGDQGPAVVPGKSGESLLLAAASHANDTVMPPPDNLVNAKPLTPAELGLLKLWIDQGAAGKSEAGEAAREIQWQSPPSGYQPAFAAAVTPDGQFAVCSRGRNLCVYHLPTGKLAAQLIDPTVGTAAHLDFVRSLAFDPAGEQLASGAFREVKLWRRPRVAQVVQFKHDTPLRSLAINANGRQVASGDDKGRIQLWQANDSRVTHTIAAHDAPVTGIAFTTVADGMLVSCSADKTLKSWKTDGTPLSRAVLPVSILSLAVIDQGRRLITGDERGVILVWDAESLAKPAAAEPIKPLAEIQAHSGAVSCLAAGPASKAQEFYSGGTDGLVRCWDGATSKKLSELKPDVPVSAVAVSGDGRRIAAAGAESLKVWDENGKLLATLSDPRSAARLAKLDSEITFTKAVINRSENDLKSYEGLIRITSVTKDAVKTAEDELTKAQKVRDEKKAALEKVKADEKAEKSAVDAAERALATAETAVVVAGTVIDRAKAVAERTAQRLADAQQELAAQKELLQSRETARAELAAATKASGPNNRVRALEFSVDPPCLAVGCEDGAVHFFDSESAAPSQSIEGHRGAVVTLAMSRGLLVTGSADHSAAVWSVPDRWRLERTIGGLDQPQVLVDRVVSVDFNHDGRWLATGGGVPSRSGEVKIFDVADGKLIRAIGERQTETVFAVRFSPRDNRLAVADGERLIRIFEATSGQELRRLAGHTGHVLNLGWKADGKLLISAGADQVLKLWDLDSGLPVRTMKGGVFGNRTYKGPVTSVTFIGDSEEILAASGDGTVRLHRACSDHEILTFAGSTGYQFTAVATPDGKAAIATDSSGTLRVWTGHQAQPKLTLGP